MTGVTVKSPSGHYNWRTIGRLALRHKKKILMAQAVALLAALAAVPVPLLIPMLVDEVLLNHPGTAVTFINRWFPAAWHGPVLYIAVILGVSFVLRIIALIFNVLQTRQFVKVSKDIIFRLRSELLQRLEKVAMAEYESLGSGTVVTHLVTDLDTLDNFLGATISRSLISVLTILGTAAILLWIHWPLALFILCLNPIVIYFTKALGKQVKRLKKKENSALEAFQQALTETLDAIQQIRASNREHYYFGRLTDKASQVKQDASNYAWKSDALNRLSFVIFLHGVDLFRATAMLMVVFSDLTIGQMLAVFGYLWFMMAPVQELLGIQYAFYGAQAALTRINRLLDLKQEPRYPHRENPFKNKRTTGVSVQDLHFSYGHEIEVLKGVTLDIQAGEKVALVGASGGGKSTLVQVLIGLYSPTSGMVYYDDIPITQIGMDVVRENVVTVLQHPVLFNDTIRANLTLGHDHADLALWRALEIAQLKDTIQRLPAQLDTIIGRSGMRLSGGQRQRLAIARMILMNPKVVILDEATSALDTETEQRLHDALSGFLTNRTTIIVAHRLSAVKQADRVYVFEDGQICEQGEHERLLSLNGLYAKLYGESQQALP
ncbi:MAG: ABC transporter ATP-binding protein [Methylothermaceae bacteria B42]|nr:MAG: ABC transporter ATP-binding protein [Methylothermaceae bacteria B42]HHJ40091.1 ABC transporter ATP-binding protein [Methylothermaceae bacterium]